MTIEICANSFDSALAAQNAGANRIELCTQLSVGGLTPSHGLIEKIITDLSIPVHVLIRPRAGDFHYSEQELDIMKKDIKHCKDLGCAGVVSGVLTTTNEIDLSRNRQLVEAAKGMEFTFHRAFDICKNPLQSFELLKLLKVNRLLSSGQQAKAIDGIELLSRLTSISEEIQIMPGGGINPNNALAFKEAGFKMIHFSASKKVLISKSESAVSFNEGIEGTSDEETIKHIIDLLN